MPNPEQASNRTLTGKCLCGAVQYTVADKFVYAANCHCSNCRRATGSAFKPFAGIERGELALIKGENNLLILGDELGNEHVARHAARCFIRSSGTVLSSTSPWERLSTIQPSVRTSTFRRL